MAKWYLQVKGEYLTKEDLNVMFNALSCEPENKRPEAQAGNTWLVAVDGPDDMDQNTGRLPGLVGIRPRMEK